MEEVVRVCHVTLWIDQFLFFYVWEGCKDKDCKEIVSDLTTDLDGSYSDRMKKKKNIFTFKKKKKKNS